MIKIHHSKDKLFYATFVDKTGSAIFTSRRYTRKNNLINTIKIIAGNFLQRNVEVEDTTKVVATGEFWKFILKAK